MASETRTLTQETVDGFKRIQAGTGTLADVRRTTGVAQSTVSRRYQKWLTSQEAGSPAAPAFVKPKPHRPSRAAKPAGIEGFRALFSPSKRGHDAIDKILAGELKDRGWIYDTEMRALTRIDSVTWTNLRRDYEELIIEVRDPESSSRKTVWCHPDIVEDAREIAKERSR